MATAFNENEKVLIREKLVMAAQECLNKYGVRKTTVDMLVQMAGISKGAFYIFYPSKEVLFYRVFEDYQRTIMEDAFSELEGSRSISRGGFSHLIYELYQKVRSSFIMNIVQNNEFEFLMRKVPEELVYNHHSLDDMLAKKLLDQLKLRKNIEQGVVTASLRAVFVSMLHIKEIGEEHFDNVLRLLISGLAEQLIEEGERNE
jgi:AcrR family transcriptional regulator